MNNAMSAKGEFGATRYDDSRKLDYWIGRAFWISSELRNPLYIEKHKAKTRLDVLTEKAINKRENPFFRELLHKGNYKYKASDFKSERQR